MYEYLTHKEEINGYNMKTEKINTASPSTPSKK
jgi:hypothetical protein